MEKCALVVVDVQNYFINEHTSNIPQKISNFISEHGNEFNFILFTKFVNRENSNFVKLMNWRECMSSPDIDISPELSRFIEKSNVFIKNSYSAFKSKKFSEFLKKNEIRKIFLCGVDIDACILATAFDAFDLGYDVKILKNLCGSHYGKKFHESALQIINKNIFKC